MFVTTDVHSVIYKSSPIPVAALSKAWVCGRSLAVIVCSNIIEYYLKGGTVKVKRLGTQVQNLLLPKCLDRCWVFYITLLETN